MELNKEKTKDLIEIYNQIDAFLSFIDKEEENLDKE